MDSENPFIRAWWKALDDHEARFDMLNAYQADLLGRADEMLKCGLVDRLEHFELRELVRAAVSHALEEKLSDFLQPNCQYDLIDADGEVVGRVDGHAIYFGDDNGIYNRAIAKRGASFFRVIGFGLGTTIGCIRGDTLHRIGLPPLRLALKSRRCNGLIYPI